MTDPFTQRLNNYQKQEFNSVQKSNQNFLISLRKSKRSALLKQFRNTVQQKEEDLNSAFYLTRPSDYLFSCFPELQNAGTELEKLKIYSELLKYPEIPESLTQEILSILAYSISTTNPQHDPRPYFLKHGIPEVLFELIKDLDDVPIIAQAVFCLSNFMAGAQNYSALVPDNVLARLVQLIDLGDEDLTDHIFFLIGNLIIDSAEVFQKMLELRILFKISDVDFSKVVPGHSVAFCVCAMSTHSDSITLAQCANILKILEKMAERQISYTLLGLSQITSKNNDFMTLVLNSDLLKQLILNSLAMPGEICSHGLAILANFSSGGKDHEDFILKNNCLDVFHSILKKVAEQDVKTIYLTMNNLAAGNFQLRCLVSTHPIVLEHEFAFSHFSEKVRQEVSSFYLSILKFAPVEMKVNLIDTGIFFQVCPNFSSNNMSLVFNCVLISGQLLNVEKFVLMDISTIFKESGCLEKIEELTVCSTEEVAKSAVDLFNTYFT